MLACLSGSRLCGSRCQGWPGLLEGGGFIGCGHEPGNSMYGYIIDVVFRVGKAYTASPLRADTQAWLFFKVHL